MIGPLAAQITPYWIPISIFKMIENIPATSDLFNGTWNTQPEWVLWIYFTPELQCSLPLFLGDFCFNPPLYTLPHNSALSSSRAMCIPWIFPTSCQSSLSRFFPGPFNDIQSTGKIRTGHDDNRLYLTSGLEPFYNFLLLGWISYLWLLLEAMNTALETPTFLAEANLCILVRFAQHLSYPS